MNDKIRIIPKLEIKNDNVIKVNTNVPPIIFRNQLNFFFAKIYAADQLTDK